MSDRPEMCQYNGCEDAPDGALDFYFGIRWYCTQHYALMIQDWTQTDGPDIHEEPIDD